MTVDTALVCEVCRAEVVLVGGRTTQQADVLTFCDAHRPHTTGVGFSLNSPLPEPGSLTPNGDFMAAGATVIDLTGTGRSLTIHAALSDMSSLCGLIAPGTLLRMHHQPWSRIPSNHRCSDCNAFS